MKKYLLLLSLVFFLAFAPTAFASGTYVQSAVNVAGGNVSTTTVSQAYPSNVTAGGLLVAAVVWRSANDPAGTRPVVTDSLGQTWTLAIEEDNTDGNGGPSQYRSIGIWYFYNTSGGANTVTATFPISLSNRAIGIVEATGILTVSNPLDKSTALRQSNPGTTADAVTSGAQTTTTDGQFIFGANVNTFGANPAFSGGTGFTLRESGEDTVAASTAWLFLETGTQTSAGAVAATFTKGVSGGSDTTIMATFKASAGGGGGGGTVKQRRTIESPRTGTRTVR